MGSGATAQRMAYGASLAEKQSYIETLKAQQQDVSGIAAQQQSRINTLAGQVSGAQQPQFIQEAVAKIKEMNPAFIAAAIFGLLFLLSKK